VFIIQDRIQSISSTIILST